MKLSRLIRRDPAAPTLRERAADLASGLARLKTRKPPREADAGRRAVMGGALAAAVPLPALAAPVAPASDLAQACDWAIAHVAWINETSVREGWPDERLDAELDRFDGVLDRAADEPSVGLADLAAKARILDCDWRAALQGHDLDPLERALFALLREVAALAPATRPLPAPMPLRDEPGRVSPEEIAFLALIPAALPLIRRMIPHRAEARRLYAESEIAAGEHPGFDDVDALRAWSARGERHREGSGYHAAWAGWSDLALELDDRAAGLSRVPMRSLRAILFKAALAPVHDGWGEGAAADLQRLAARRFDLPAADAPTA